MLLMVKVIVGALCLEELTLVEEALIVAQVQVMTFVQLVCCRRNTPATAKLYSSYFPTVRVKVDVSPV